MSKNIWLISDSHFGHAKIIGYCNRPFKDFREMDEAMIENWNAVVKSEDDIYHLGDFACGPDATPGYVMSIRNRLQGNVHMIKGNHDHKERLTGLPFVWVKDYHELKVGKKMFVLFHFPQLTWSQAIHGSYHCFGHVHGKIKGLGKSMEVGVDVTDFKPVNIEDVAAKLDKIEIVQSI